MQETPQASLPVAAPKNLLFPEELLQQGLGSVCCLVINILLSCPQLPPLQPASFLNRGQGSGKLLELFLLLSREVDEASGLMATF